MFEESSLLPLSALQHLLYCKRRAALVHTECLWADNAVTAEGVVAHKKADQEGLSELRDGVRIVRALRLRSLRLGLAGKADVVEFHPVDTSDPSASRQPGLQVYWQPFPVEYKRGRYRKEEGYEVQLCAQALCLEEMLGAAVPAGAIFYGKSRRRKEVLFDAALREETEDAARRLHELISSGRTPPAVHSKKCAECSLAGQCLPRACGSRVGDYLTEMLRE